MSGKRENTDSNYMQYINTRASLLAQLVKKNWPAMRDPACNAGDLGSIPGLGRSPGEGNDNPFQHSCLENPAEREAWQATVHGVTGVRHHLVT